MGRVLGVAFAVLGTVAVNGLIVARLFIDFPLHAALGWVMITIASLMIIFGIWVSPRRQVSIDPVPEWRVGEWIGWILITTVFGVVMLALSPILDR